HVSRHERRGLFHRIAWTDRGCAASWQRRKYQHFGDDVMPKKMTLPERVEALRAECDAELDRLAEERRPKGETGVPAPTIRQLWMARVGVNNVFEALLLAHKQCNRQRGAERLRPFSPS